MLSIQTLPINGALTQRLTQTGTMWQYTPNSDFAGTDTFVYKATDRSGASNTATVTVTVRQGWLYGCSCLYRELLGTAWCAVVARGLVLRI